MDANWESTSQASLKSALFWIKAYLCLKKRSSILLTDGNAFLVLQQGGSSSHAGVRIEEGRNISWILSWLTVSFFGGPALLGWECINTSASLFVPYKSPGEELRVWRVSGVTRWVVIQAMVPNVGPELSSVSSPCGPSSFALSQHSCDSCSPRSFQSSFSTTVCPNVGFLPINTSP